MSSLMNYTVVGALVFLVAPDVESDRTGIVYDGKMCSVQQLTIGDSVTARKSANRFFVDAATISSYRS